MAEKPTWYGAYPSPRNKQPTAVSAQDLLARFQRGKKPGLDFLLIDLRRTDYEVGRGQTLDSTCPKPEIG
jgi:arsenical-resistance protein 2